MRGNRYNGYSFAIRFLFFTKTGAKVVLPAVGIIKHKCSFGELKKKQKEKKDRGALASFNKHR